MLLQTPSKSSTWKLIRLRNFYGKHYLFWAKTDLVISLKNVLCLLYIFFFCFVVAVTDVAAAIIIVVGSAIVATVACTTIKMNAPMTAKDSRHVHIAPNYHTQHFALLVAISIEMRIISYFRAEIAAARILRLSSTSFHHVNQVRSLYNKLCDRVPCHLKCLFFWHCSLCFFRCRFRVIIYLMKIPRIVLRIGKSPNYHIGQKCAGKCLSFFKTKLLS